MKTLRIWAPLPEKLSVVTHSGNTPMIRGENGWWSVEVSDDSGDYGFIADGEGPFPDPRSPWQPDGIDGLSRPVDFQAFEWTDAGFRAPPLAAAVIYEAHAGTFSEEGTFEGMIPHLDHLVELGVTHLELMPVNEFSGEWGWGYDGVDWFAPHHAYGGPAGLQKLVDACHSRGLAVLLDVVYNHLGPAGNYLGRFGPYFNSAYKTFWGDAVNLDGPHSEEVRRFICDNALMWLRDYHFDGLRIDAVHALDDRSATHILEQLEREVRTLESATGRSYVLIAESDLNDPRLLWSLDRGGFGLDAQWSDDFHHALHAVLTGERDGYYEDFGRLEQVAKALRNAYVYDGQYSKHRQRRHGRPPDGLTGRRFLGYLQNHDQIGNRAAGDRSSHLMNDGRLKIGAALVMTSPFVPMLFQGEEWGASSPFIYFTSHEDEELGQAVREGRRREFAAFGWREEDVPDPQERSSFLRSKLDWNEIRGDRHQALLKWHRDLIRLRRSHPDLADDCLCAVDVNFDEAARWLTVKRGRLVAAVNLAMQRQKVPLPSEESWRTLMISDDDIHPSKDHINLPPDSVAILTT
jgi:maltooligosyltrehalose trehalohydrolase